MLMAVVVALAASLFFVVRDVRRNAAWTESVSEYSSRFKSWVTERKQHLNQTVAQVKKQVGERDDSERVVNFEFYNTLQDMKSMQVDATAKVNQSLEQKALAKTAEKAVTTPAVKTKKIVKITQASDLENDLLSVIKQPRGGK